MNNTERFASIFVIYTLAYVFNPKERERRIKRNKSRRNRESIDGRWYKGV